jgi:subtilisin family serine protease
VQWKPCVASFSADGSVSHFSDFGDAVDVAAPGHKILSAWPTNLFPSFFTERKGYDFKSGTSMAAPFVTGALARLLNAGYSPDEAYARLIAGARPHLAPRAMTELEPKFTLSGNLNLAGAMRASPRSLVLPADKEPMLAP